MAKLTHSSASSLSVDGEEIAANTDGIFDVPDKHVAILQEHGFELASMPAEKPKKDTPK